MPRGPKPDIAPRASLRYFLAETASSATILHRRFRRIRPDVTIPKAWFQFLAVLLSVSPKSLAHGPSQVSVFLTDCIQLSSHFTQFARRIRSDKALAHNFNRVVSVLWPYTKLPSTLLIESLKHHDLRESGAWSHMTPHKYIKDTVVERGSFGLTPVPFDNFFDYFTCHLPNIGSMQNDYPLRDGCKLMPTADELNVTKVCRVVAPWIFSQPRMTRMFNIRLFRAMVSYLVGDEAAATFVVEVGLGVNVVSRLHSKKRRLGQCAPLLAC